MTMYAHIVGWGKYLPEKVVTNHDLAQIMDTSDDWIKSRTGISERRFAGKDESTATMAIAAAQLALDRARITPAAVDLIIVATVSPEHSFPSTACLVQDALGASHAGAFDLSAACSGFIYGLSMATASIKSGAAKVVVVIGAETLSRLMDIEDRTTYPLFGDGAGAVVVQAHETPGGILATVLGADGSGGEHLCVPAGGSKLPTSPETVAQRLHYIKMNGREVYRFATRVMGKAAKQACEKAGVSLEEVDLLIPHQANIRIIESASNYLKLDQDKVFTNLDRYGNTSAASIPIALCEALENGRVQNKDKLVMVGFGAGLTWAAAVIEWGVPMPYRRREWWYKIIRWFVYRWARVRSLSMRASRRVEGMFVDHGDMTVTPPPDKEKPAKEKAKPDKSTPETPAPEQPVKEKPIPEKVVLEKTAPEKVMSEKPAKEKSAPEKVVSEKPAKEKSAPEKVVSEKPVKEKAAPEKVVAQEPLPEKSVPAKASPEKPGNEAEPAQAGNGNGSKPAPVTLPTELPVKKVAEAEKVVETKKPLNGK